MDSTPIEEQVPLPGKWPVDPQEDVPISEGVNCKPTVVAEVKASVDPKSVLRDWYILLRINRPHPLPLLYNSGLYKTSEQS
jgi:hypothetical protein